MKTLIGIKEKKVSICVVDHGNSRREALIIVLRKMGYSNFVKCGSYGDISDIQTLFKLHRSIGSFQPWATNPERILGPFLYAAWLC